MAPSLVYDNITGEYDRLLKKEFLSPFRKGYLMVNGCVLPEYFREFGDQIENLDVRADDVWVCSFPKCGTTWVQEMAWLIANDLNYEAAKEPIQERFPFLEHTPLFDYREFPNFSAPPHVANSIEFINKMKSPRFIKTHLPYNILSGQFSTAKPKIIYVARNVKDCLISYYHHVILMEGYKGSFEEFFKLFIGDRVPFAPFWDHVLSFWQNRHRDNVLFLKYEDMKKDLSAVIKKVNAFLGKDYNEDQLKVLEKHLSFESMKNNRAVNYEIVMEINKKFGWINAEGEFIRSGKIGGYKAYMNDEQIIEIDEWSKNHLQGSDYVL